MQQPFLNRRDAGEQLAKKLSAYANEENVIVLGLHPGGAMVGYEVAKALDARFDVYLVHTINVPGHEHVTLGAIAPGGIFIRNTDSIERFSIPEETIGNLVMREEKSMQRLDNLFHKGTEKLDLLNTTVILVDDGMESGSTMLAAISAILRHEPLGITVAVPVASEWALGQLTDEVDEIVSVVTVSGPVDVENYYEEFQVLSDEDISNLVQRPLELV